MSNERRVRVLVCGLGRIGSAHFENVRTSNKLQLAGVVEADAAMRNEYAARGVCPGYANLKEALEDSKNKCDALIVCTPTATHIEFIKDGLNAGKAIFCEKPISHSVAEVDEVYHLAQSKNLMLYCGFQRRSDPSFMKLKESLKKGAVGQIMKIHTISRDHPIPPMKFLRISGGFVFDCTSHDCDVLRWLAESDPVSVYVETSSFNPEIASLQDYDNVAMVFKFPNGIIGTVDASRHSACGYDQRIEVLGDKGTIMAGNPQATTVVYGRAEGMVADPYIHSFPSRYHAAYLSELEHFADLILGKTKEPRLTHEDVRKNCIILHAAQESAAKGEIVKIKYD